MYKRQFATFRHFLTFEQNKFSYFPTFVKDKKLQLLATLCEFGFNINIQILQRKNIWIFLKISNCPFTLKDLTVFTYSSTLEGDLWKQKDSLKVGNTSKNLCGALDSAIEGNNDIYI